MKKTPAKITSPGSRPVPTTAVPSGGELLDMEQAIAVLKTTRPTFYRWLRAGKIKGIKAGRQWRFQRRDLDSFLHGEQPRIDLPVSIQPFLDELNRRLATLGVKDLAPPSDNLVADAVHRMIRLGVALRASDLHLEPQVDNGTPRIFLRYRVDGGLQPAATVDIRLMMAIVEQWKRLAACDPHERMVPQDGRILLDIGIDRRRLDLRVCFLPACYGESVTVRYLPAVSEMELSLERVFGELDRQKITRWLSIPWGLIVVTGPTGSGKTTTLYACLNHVAKAPNKILTVEDPVEYVLPGMTQVQVNPKTGMTFARALRACLRSDPDVMMIGEIRDLETLNMCLQAALTGHLVFTTMHTSDAVETLFRMVNIGSEPFVVTDATKLITAQRLVRRLCPDCRQKDPHPPQNLLEHAITMARQGGVDWDRLPREFYKPVGCAKCGQTGYRGRRAVYELLEVTPEIGSALRRGGTYAELRSLAVGQGMTTMGAQAVRLAAEGGTSLQEIMHLSIPDVMGR